MLSAMFELLRVSSCYECLVVSLCSAAVTVWLNYRNAYEYWHEQRVSLNTEIESIASSFRSNVSNTTPGGSTLFLQLTVDDVGVCVPLFPSYVVCCIHNWLYQSSLTSAYIAFPPTICFPYLFIISPWMLFYQIVRQRVSILSYEFTDAALLTAFRYFVSVCQLIILMLFKLLRVCTLLQLCETCANILVNFGDSLYLSWCQWNVSSSFGVICTTY